MGRGRSCILSDQHVISRVSLPSGVQLGLGPSPRISGGVVWCVGVCTPTKATRSVRRLSLSLAACRPKHQAPLSTKSDFAPIRKLASGATLVNTQSSPTRALVHCARAYLFPRQVHFLPHDLGRVGPSNRSPTPFFHRQHLPAALRPLSTIERVSTTMLVCRPPTNANFMRCELPLLVRRHG